MSSVRILVSYEGEWVVSPKQGIFKFNGTKVKGISVPKNIKYIGLLDKVYRLLMVDPNEFSISMKVLYASSMPVPPAEVVNDDDVSFFISENSSSNISLRTPLCITFVRKCSETCNEPERQHTSKPILTRTRTEESVPDFCVDTDVGRTSSEELANGDVSIEPQVEQPQEKANATVPANPASATSHSNQTQDAESLDQWVTTREDLTAIKIDAVAASRKEVPTREILPGSSVSHSRELELRQLFSSKKELQEKLSMLAIKESFEYKVKRSSSKLLEVKCIEDGCEWELRAIVVRDSAAFKVKRLGKAHSCSKETRSNERNRQATSWVIGQHIKSKCQGINGSYKPRQIIEVVRRELGINLSYAKAWRIKVMALDSKDGAKKQPQKPSAQRVGRPKKQKVELPKEDKSSQNRCGSCGVPGHYRQTCSALVEANPNGTFGKEAAPLQVALEG